MSVPGAQPGAQPEAHVERLRRRARYHRHLADVADELIKEGTLSQTNIEGRETVILASPDELKPYVHQYMPNLSPEAYEALKEDIRENGILMPLLLDEDYAIVDGHNRVRVWHELIEEGNDPAPVAAHVIPGLDPHSAHNLAIAVNTKRRNMTPPQKRELVAEELRYLARYYAEQGYTGEESRSWDTARLARHLAVSQDIVRDERRKMEAAQDLPYAHYFVISTGKGERVVPRERMSKGTPENLVPGPSPRFLGEDSDTKGHEKGGVAVPNGAEIAVPVASPRASRIRASGLRIKPVIVEIASSMGWNSGG